MISDVFELELSFLGSTIRIIRCLDNEIMRRHLVSILKVTWLSRVAVYRVGMDDVSGYRSAVEKPAGLLYQ